MKRINLVTGVVALAVAIAFAQYWVFSLDYQTRGRIMRIQIVILIQTVMALGDVFVWKNISRTFDGGYNLSPGQNRNETEVKNLNVTSRNRTNGKLWRVLVVLYLTLAHCSYLTNIFLVRTEPASFAILTYFVLAFHIQLFTALILLKIFRYFVKLYFKRTLPQKYVALVSVVYAILLASTGFINALRPPTVKHTVIPVKDLPDSLEGFSIVHISDVHLGPTVGRSKLERIVKIVNDLKPDLVVIVGDLVDGYVRDLKGSIEVIKDINSKNGVYFVTGNHEYFTVDVNNWFEHLKSLGVHVLHNSHDAIPRNAPKKEQFCLVGTDDLQADTIMYGDHGFKLDQAVAGCDTNRPVVLLAHQPRAAKRALESKHRIDLVLSGHTHGGQMFPGTILVYLVNPYFAGLYKHGENSHVYVSMGSVYWGIPVRLLSTQEIARITLTKL